MTNPRTERLALNEFLFREVNERLREVFAAQHAPEEWPSFVCECGDAGCTERFAMTLREYAILRADPACFAVAFGHEIPDIELVLGGNERFVLVMKTGAARELVEAAVTGGLGP